MLSGNWTSWKLVMDPAHHHRIAAGAYRSCPPGCSGLALPEWNETRTSCHATPIRLDDLRAWHVVFAACALCGKRTHIDARLLAHGRPPYTKLLDLERKLRCTS